MKVTEIITVYKITTPTGGDWKVEWDYNFLGNRWDVTVTSPNHLKMADKTFTKKYYHDTVPSVELCRKILKELMESLFPEQEKDILDTLQLNQTKQ